VCVCECVCVWGGSVMAMGGGQVVSVVYGYRTVREIVCDMKK